MLLVFHQRTVVIGVVDKVTIIVTVTGITAGISVGVRLVLVGIDRTVVISVGHGVVIVIVIADITGSVTVEVGLTRVAEDGTIVDGIGEAIAIAVAAIVPIIITEAGVEFEFAIGVLARDVYGPIIHASIIDDAGHDGVVTSEAFGTSEVSPTGVLTGRRAASTQTVRKIGAGLNMNVITLAEHIVLAIAHVTDAVPIAVGLVVIGIEWTVVDVVGDLVTIGIAIARITQSIAIEVGLVGVGHVGTVVFAIEALVSVTIRITNVTDIVVISIGLFGVSIGRTVVVGIDHAIIIAVPICVVVHGVADITDAIFIDVGLVGVDVVGTIVIVIAHSVTIVIRSGRRVVTEAGLVFWITIRQ